MNNEEMKKALREAKAKQDREMSYLLLERAFTGNFNISGNTVNLYKRDKKTERIDKQTFYNEIYFMIKRMCGNTKSDKRNNRSQYRFEAFAITVLIEKSLRLFSERNKEFINFSNKLKDIYLDLKNSLSEEDYQDIIISVLNDILSSNIQENSDNSNTENESNNEKDEEDIFWEKQPFLKITGDDIEFFVRNFMTPEEFEKNKELYITALVENEAGLKKLEKSGYITPKDVTNNIDSEQLLKLIEDGHNYLIKYLTPKYRLKAYKRGLIDIKALSKISVNDLIVEGLGILDKEEMIEILIKNRKSYNKGTTTDLLWELYEREYFNLDEIKKIASYGYIDINKIIKNYTEERSRKIKFELEKAKVSDEKMVEYLSPNQIILYKNNPDAISEESMSFIKNDLKDIYGNLQRDYEAELIEEEKKSTEDKELAKLKCLNLYKDGFISLDSFGPGELSEEDIISFYNKQKDDTIIIDAFNHSILSNITTFEILDDGKDKIFSHIENDGLNPQILTEFCSTAELVKAFKEGSISINTLVALKESIKIEDIERLYKSKEISLALLNYFTKNGLIDEEKAEEIKDSYEILVDFEKLRERGVVEGLDNLDFIRAEEHKATKTKLDRGGHSEKSFDKIGKENRDALFEALGADAQRLPVTGELLAGYEMISFLDKGIAILEPKGGRNTTFILPLRVILEQVQENKNKNIIATAKYKKEIADDENVEIAIHTKNWGRNVIKKMCVLDRKFKATNPLGSGRYSAQISAIANSYCRNHEKNKCK